MSKKPTSPGELFKPVEHPHDGTAMGHYLERYKYDEVGNFLSMQHETTASTAQGWTRHYTYDDPSVLESEKFSNRLSHTSIGAATETYQYEGNAGLHGNITSMPNLPLVT